MDVLAKLKTSSSFIRFTRSEYIDADLIDLPITRSVQRITLLPKDYDRHNNLKITLHEVQRERCIAHRENVTIPINATELLARPGIGIVFDHEPKLKSKKSNSRSSVRGYDCERIPSITTFTKRAFRVLLCVFNRPMDFVRQMNLNHSTVYTYRNNQHMFTWHPAELIDDIVHVLEQVTKQTNIQHGDLFMLTSDSYASPCRVLDTIDVTIDGIGTLQNSFQFLATRSSENRYRAEYSEQ